MTAAAGHFGGAVAPAEPQPRAPAGTAVAGAARKTWIVSPAYDLFFFLGSPLLALAAGAAISGTTFSEQTFELLGQEVTGAGLAIGTLIHAHLAAVFVRSHGNEAIFQRHPIRFVLVPVVLWAALASSEIAAVAGSVVATFWDVWHSGAQTFGLGRIYDRNRGNPPLAGRRLDFWLNQLLYAGPILAGATLIDHLGSLEELEDVGIALFSVAPASVEGTQRWLAWAVVAAGTLFVAFYLGFQWRLHRRGIRVTPQKIFLLASTGLCSIWAWGFNSWGEAFFIMNAFHAVQYLALVWANERRTLLERPRLRERPRARRLVVAIVAAGILAYGAAAELVSDGSGGLWALTVTVSLLHFWYDGFIWSVRRRQV